jgi:acetyl-CoA C-acetyltransferase
MKFVYQNGASTWQSLISAGGTQINTRRNVQDERGGHRQRSENGNRHIRRGLKTVPVVDLGALVMKAAVKRAGCSAREKRPDGASAPDALKDQGDIDLEKENRDWDHSAPEITIDEVIMGNVLQAAQGQNPARQAMIRAGIPKETPAMTINKVCGSGLKAIAIGAAAIMSGQADVILAGGQENMSQVPMALPKARWGHRMELTGVGDIYDLMVFDGLYEIFYGYHMGLTAENIAALYGISRQEQDELGVLSHSRARKAMADGLFAEEIVPVTIKTRKGDVVFDTDERPMDTSLEKMAKLRPAFKKDGTVTAGNASGINDAAAAVLMMSAEKAADLGLETIVKVKAVAGGGLDPAYMGLGPGAGRSQSLGGHRHERIRHRNDRTQRSVCSPGDRLFPGAGHRSRKGQRAGQRHLSRAPHRMHRRPSDGHGHEPHETQRLRHRPDHHVHRGRNGLGNGGGTIG